MSEVKRKFDDISKKYDEQRRKLIPCFDDFYNISVSVASVDTDYPNIIDIGAGTGLLTSYILEKYPHATVTLIDLSEKMLEVAKERLKRNENIKYVIADYTNYNAGEKYDMVLSALSIHHLEDSVKESLYNSCYSLLKPNGIIINADQVHGETPYIEALNKNFWRKSIEDSGLEKEEIQSAYERIKLDKETSLDQQLKWLKEAGFSDVSCVYKYYHFAVMFGRKPM